MSKTDQLPIMRNGTSVQTGMVPDQTWTPEQLQLIKDTVAKGATDDELKLFLYRCKNLGLDPLKPGQIHFVKYGNSPGTIIVGIEGFRSKAARTKLLNGINRGVIKDDKGRLIAGWCEVRRKDWDHPAREEVPFQEYNTGKSNWAKMPETMIKKVAEAAALRMAFPDDLGGIYTKEEMEQAERGTVYPEQPDVDDGIELDRGYVIDFGKWNRKTLEQVYRDEGPNAIQDYIVYLEDSARKKGATIQGKPKLFIEEAEAFLGAMENAPLEEDIPFEE